MTAEAPKLPKATAIPLLSLVAIPEGEGAVIGVSYDQPRRYDVLLTDGRVVRNAIAPRLVKPYDGPPLERLR